MAAYTGLFDEDLLLFYFCDKYLNLLELILTIKSIVFPLLSVTFLFG